MIPDSYKSKYYRQVRQVFYTESVVPMITATAVMAFGIALVELPCTAGFPFVWTGLVSTMNLSFSQFALLFALYILVYLSVELVIFFIAVVRLRSMKMTEERGRFLKLIAGALMLVLGSVLLFFPDLMESITGLLLAFGASALLTALLYLVRKLFTISANKTTPLK